MFEPTFTNPKVGFPKIPILGIPSLFDYEFGRSKKKKSKFKTRYTPNIAAIGLGIKATKIPKSYKLGLGALAIRPVIAGLGKRKRRKSKR